MLSALALSAVVMGCGDGSVPTGATVDTPASAVAVAPAGQSPLVVQGDVRLRVAHLSTDAPPVDVWVNGSVVLSNVPFGAISDYLALDAGEYRIQVTPAGAQAPIVIDATVPLASGNVYTVAAVGFLSSGSLEPLVLLDDLATGGGARIRFVHASADTGAVDVAVTGGPVLFSEVTFQEASDYAEVPAGTYDLEARPAGSSTVALSIPGVSVSSGTTYTVFAIGRSFNGSLSVLPVVDAP
jgi:hypothetical protein